MNTKTIFFGLILAAIFFLGSGHIYAGPPFVTDDPEPVEFRHWEFYLASQYARTSAGTSGTAPHMEMNYGAAPNLQIHLIAPVAFDHPNNSPKKTGYGDTEVGAKYRFVQESKYIPQVGSFPLVEIPTGNSGRGLGNGKAQVFIPLWLQKSWGPWTSYGGGGYWINPGDGNKNWIYTGWLLQRDFSKALTLGGEIFHRTASTVDGESGTGFDAGGQINFGEHTHFLFSAGKDFSGPNQLTRYAALQWTF